MPQWWFVVVKRNVIIQISLELMGNPVSKTEDNTTMTAHQLAGFVTGMITGHQPATLAPTAAVATHATVDGAAHLVDGAVQPPTDRLVRPPTATAVALSYLLKIQNRDACQNYCDSLNLASVHKVPYNYNDPRPGPVPIRGAHVGVRG
jgi:hypothetical protein